MEEPLDNSSGVGIILMDLCKSYDCLPHYLLIAKSPACGFNIASLCLVQLYFRNDLWMFLEWFTCNGMAVSFNESQLMLLCLKWKENLCIIINGVKLKHAKLLGVDIDVMLKFDKQVGTLCQKSTKGPGYLRD